MSSLSRDEIHFLVRYGELMTLVTFATDFYDVDLRKYFRELITVYSNWTKDLASNRLDYGGRNLELDKLEFSIYCSISEELAKKFSELVSDIEKPLFINTGQYKIAIAEAKRKKAIAENQLVRGKNVQECIDSAKKNVDELFERYSNCKAECKNLERNALFKWCGVLGGLFSIIMFVYFSALSYTKTTLDFGSVIVFPVFVGVLMLGALLVWFPSIELED
jgi:hypothetical protein